MIALAIAILGHVLLTIAALPYMLQSTSAALTWFLIGLGVFGLGTAGFKPNISPLIAEQVANDKPRISFNSTTGEKVIIDPSQTIGRIYNWFYLFINVGALFGQILMSYAALYVGYWLAFLLPTLMFLLCPIVLWANKSNYRLTPPQGSILAPALHVMSFVIRPHLSWNLWTTVSKLRHTPHLWEAVKPSRIPQAKRPKWMTFDDKFVADLRQGLRACSVLAWMPLYMITYNQMNNNTTSQADTLRHKGIPPELVSNADPLSLVLLIPLCDLIIYPYLRKRGVRLTPIRKITLGFWVGALAMLYAALLQHYIYTYNPCGSYPSESITQPDGTSEECPPTDLSIFWQIPLYVLVAISEILASITSLEYAFTKAPKNMRSIILAIFMLLNAGANVIGEGFLWLAKDPLLVWNYGVMGTVAFVAGGLFFWCNKHDDDREDIGAEDFEMEGVEGKETGKGSRRSGDVGWYNVGEDSDDEDDALRDRHHQRLMNMDTGS
jgi:proton-dependent oligopeptide transporter, POT family